MYELVEKTNVITELNNGVELWCVDVPTLRTMKCADMNLQAIKGFIVKPEAIFLKRVADE